MYIYNIIKMTEKLQDSKFDADKYRLEIHRIESFKNWPNLLPPEKLAAAGFYYTGESDKVQCFECQIKLIKWEENDNPMDDHKRDSPRCRFIRGFPCGNVPIGVDPNTIPIMPRGMDVCGSYNSIEKFHSILSHPRYDTYEARLASFNTWPKVMFHLKRELAVAGFFYTGKADRTQCYSCGLELKDWKLDDDPWQNHAQSFRYCPYLFRVRGCEYVAEVINRTNRISGKLGTMEPSTSNKSNEQHKKVNNTCITFGNSQSSTSFEDTVIENTGSAEGSSKKQSTVTTSNNESFPGLCKYCYLREREIVFSCKHFICCKKCAPNASICKKCGIPIKGHFLVVLT